MQLTCIQMQRAEIIRIARTWLGVPFLHQGRSRDGVDCGGLLIVVGREAGVEILEPLTYSMSPDPAVIRAPLEMHCAVIPVADALPGDVLWLSFAGEPRHVAIVSDIGMIHAWAGPGKVVEHRIDATWQRRIRAAYRPRGVV